MVPYLQSDARGSDDHEEPDTMPPYDADTQKIIDGEQMRHQSTFFFL